MDKPHRVAPIPLTLEEEKRLHTHLSVEDQDKVRLATITGLRRGQLFGLRWEIIDWANGGVHLPTFKRQKPRFLPVPTEGMDMLHRRWTAARQPTTGPVFPSADDPTVPEEADSWYRYHFIKRAVKKAGLAGKGITFHNTRHTWATRFLEGGGHIRALQKAGIGRTCGSSKSTPTCTTNS